MRADPHERRKRVSQRGSGGINLYLGNGSSLGDKLTKTEEKGDRMKDENSLYWIWLSEKCGIACKEFGRLAERYENPYDLYRLEEEEIEQLEGISRSLKTRLTEKSLESSYAILRYCRQNRVAVIGYHDKRYPARLRSIENPPVLLYALGKIPDWNSRLCIGMVGTRKMSEYGQQTAY